MRCHRSQEKSTLQRRGSGQRCWNAVEESRRGQRCEPWTWKMQSLGSLLRTVSSESRDASWCNRLGDNPGWGSGDGNVCFQGAAEKEEVAGGDYGIQDGCFIKDERYKSMFYAEGNDQVQGITGGKEERNCKTKSWEERGGWGPEHQRRGKGISPVLTEGNKGTSTGVDVRKSGKR